GGPGGRTLEQHVLEVMGEAELAGAFIARTALDPKLQSDHIACTMLFDDDGDAVGEHIPRGSIDGWSSRWLRRSDRATSSSPHDDEDAGQTQASQPEHEP